MPSIGFPPRVHAHRTDDVVQHQALEGAVPVAQIHIVEVRLRRKLERAAPCRGSAHCGTFTGRSTTAFNTLKTTALAPIPSASVKIAVIVNPGDFLNCRNAILSSLVIMAAPETGLRWRPMDGSLRISVRRFSRFEDWDPITQRGALLRH